MRFAVDLGKGDSLALRTLDTIETMHRLTVKNLDRLREWEPWAQSEPSSESSTEFTRMQLEQFARGAVVPTVIFHGEEAVGSASLRMDRYLGIGEIGYWIDRDAEGKGIAFRACSALVGHALGEGIRRLEIRTASSNDRSCRLAERLGFEREGILRHALPIGSTRLDVTIYGLVLAP
ncbi:MAG: GNAT family N-acetyltransferase [Actinomycetota bacterium]|nr:GNAT family N-acetyltransferase [Actinomycetota bacterium]